MRLTCVVGLPPCVGRRDYGGYGHNHPFCSPTYNTTHNPRRDVRCPSASYPLPSPSSLPAVPSTCICQSIYPTISLSVSLFACWIPTHHLRPPGRISASTCMGGKVSELRRWGARSQTVAVAAFALGNKVRQYINICRRGSLACGMFGLVSLPCAHIYPLCSPRSYSSLPSAMRARAVLWVGMMAHIHSISI